MKDLATVIAGAVKEGLELWKTFISTREQSYRRAMDKKKIKAIEFAEKYILTNNDIDLDEKKKQKLLEKYAKYFFKFN